MALSGNHVSHCCEMSHKVQPKLSMLDKNIRAFENVILYFHRGLLCFDWWGNNLAKAAVWHLYEHILVNKCIKNDLLRNVQKQSCLITGERRENPLRNRSKQCLAYKPKSSCVKPRYSVAMP